MSLGQESRLPISLYPLPHRDVLLNIPCAHSSRGSGKAQASNSLPDTSWDNMKQWVTWILDISEMFQIPTRPFCVYSQNRHCYGGARALAHRLALASTTPSSRPDTLRPDVLTAVASTPRVDPKMVSSRISDASRIKYWVAHRSDGLFLPLTLGSLSYLVFLFFSISEQHSCPKTQ